MKINTDKNCNIVVFDDTDYPYNGLDYSNSASLYIVQLNQSNNPIIIYNKLDKHINSDGQPIVIESPTGGFITMCTIILPKVNDPSEFIPGNSGGYFTDGTNILYKDNQGNVRDVQEQELLEINPEPYNLNKITQNFFSVCYLRKCYISLCQKIFKDRGFDRCFNSKVSSQLIYKRDLVWAALNVIQYMIDSNQLAEAQRLLERISGCNGLCSSEDTGEKGCGCEQ